MRGMDKDLQTVQIIAKAGKVFSKIAWIFCSIGIAGSLAGFLILAVGADQAIKIGGVTLHGIIAQESGMAIGAVYAALGAEAVMCIGSMIPAIFAERYFKNELKAGTPFTYSGAKEMKRLGILTIVLPLVSSILAELIIQLVPGSTGAASNNAFSVGLGIGLLIMSAVFRYGAGLEISETDYV